MLFPLSFVETPFILSSVYTDMVAQRTDIVTSRTPPVTWAVMPTYLRVRVSASSAVPAPDLPGAPTAQCVIKVTL